MNGGQISALKRSSLREDAGIGSVLPRPGGLQERGAVENAALGEGRRVTIWSEIAEELHGVLSDPAPAARVPRRRLTPKLFSMTCVVADGAQVAIVGDLVMPRLMSDSPGGTWRLLGLGLLVAALAAFLGRAFLAITRGASVPVDGTVVHRSTAILAAVTVIASVQLVLGQWRQPLTNQMNAFFVWATVSMAFSALLYYAALHFRRAMSIRARMVVVGAPEETDRLEQQLAIVAPETWEVVGRADDRSFDGLRHLVDLVDEHGAQMVVLVAGDVEPTKRAAAVCQRLADRPIPLALALDTALLTGGLRGSASGSRLALVKLWATPCDTWSGVMKRLIDIVLSCAALVLLSPLMVAIAIAIRMETSGPIMFSQWRFGVGSRPIRVLKFRTMNASYGDNTGALRTIPRDPRVTHVGRLLRRTSADELPQLLNVLRGEMSLVGPRPHPLHMRVGEDYYFEAVESYWARHIIRPGITGWAQVNGSRGCVDTIEKARRRVALDLWYIEHWSLLLDFRILLRTLLGGFASFTAD